VSEANQAIRPRALARVFRAARFNRPVGLVDRIAAAARELGVPVTAHHVAIQRAGASVARIDAALAEAQRCGTMKFFNAEYRRRREAAGAIGRGFMTYGRARAWLRRAGRRASSPRAVRSRLRSWCWCLSIDG
jgi:hypothetical protein